MQAFCHALYEIKLSNLFAWWRASECVTSGCMCVKYVKCVCSNFCIILQSNMVQLLEIALTDRVDKELDLSQTHASNIFVDLFPDVAFEDDSIQVQDYLKCMLRGIAYLLYLSCFMCYWFYRFVIF